MQTNPASRLWTRALIALRVGSRTAARAPLARLAASSSTRADYWIALAHAAESPFVAVDCLERALGIDPGNPIALAGLEWQRWLLTRPGLATHDQSTDTTAPDKATDSHALPLIDLSPSYETSSYQTNSYETSGDNHPSDEPTEERASSVLQKIDELEAALESDLTPTRSIFVDEPARDPLSADLHAAEQVAATPDLAHTPAPVDLPAPIDLPVAATPDMPVDHPEPVSPQTPQPTLTPLSLDVALPPSPVETNELVATPAMPEWTIPTASLTPTASEQTADAPAVELADALATANISDESQTVDTTVITADIPLLSVDTPVLDAPALETPVLETPVLDSADSNNGTDATAPVSSDIPTLPVITEQELATAEWQRWVNGATPPPLPTATANPEAARIVNEVSERLAHALQRVLKQRSPADAPPTDDATTAETSSRLPAVVNVAPRLDDRLVSKSLQTTDLPPAYTPTPTAPATPDRGPKILIVDDSATIRRVVVDGLTAHGYQVCEAADGVEGIREIATQRPDLILLDITMPRLDGYRLCRLVKGHASTRHIPVVMLSGKDGTFDKLRGRLAGSSDYITKPFDTPSLIQKIESCLNTRSKKESATS